MSVVSASVLNPGVRLTSSDGIVITATNQTVITNNVFSYSGSGNQSIYCKVKRATDGNTYDIVLGRSISQNASLMLNELQSFVLNAGDQLIASGTDVTCIINGYIVS